MAAPRILVSYTTFAFQDSFWQLPPAEKRPWLRELFAALAQTGRSVSLYQVFPARSEYDFLVWSTADCETLPAPDEFFANFARRVTPFRQHVRTPAILTGITKPSMYVRQHENPQEINPYDADRKPYFVIYPFSKTVEWYLKSREDRQQLMTEHIRLGKTYPSIKQLLLYSFGIQDQEFVVAYEMDDLPLFSDLVQALRSTAARAFTLLDTPIITGTLRTADQLVEIFGGASTPAAEPPTPSRP
ncbi:MAG: chlorite dismutase family protein [Lentisphaerae bacterium]|nr:chlorite dismutase family protein [Lentisphaerota bacterium]